MDFKLPTNTKFGWLVFICGFFVFGIIGSYLKSIETSTIGYGIGLGFVLLQLGCLVAGVTEVVFRLKNRNKKTYKTLDLRAIIITTVILLLAIGFISIALEPQSNSNSPYNNPFSEEAPDNTKLQECITTVERVLESNMKGIRSKEGAQFQMELYKSRKEDCYRQFSE